MKNNIFDEEGNIVGYYQYKIYRNQKDIDDRYGGKIGEIEGILVPPLGELEHIEINEAVCKRGYGLQGMKEANEVFRKAGVKMAILKVAWYGEEPWEEARDRRVRLYKKEEWEKADDLEAPHMIKNFG